MNNTSNNKTANKPTKNKDKDKLRVIVGEIGRDSKTGILGRGYSSDNGKTFHVTDTIYGRLYDPNDIEGIWNGGTADKVKKEVDSATAEIPAAVSAANSAVSAAESAVAASKVNSDAIIAQSEAISEAKSAMDSATAEIQQTAANAASDAAKIRADVAQVQSEVDTAKAANSASVEALKSDVSAAKQDLADVHDSLTKAQAAAEESQKAIDNSIAQINSDIEQDRKDIASAQQANADTAKQLDTYSKQAQDQGKTIKSIQDKQDGFTATLADVQGNVTQVSDKVDGLSASLKDAQDNVASVKAQADQLSATLTDHAKSIATLTASAKELSSTLEDADGRLSKVEQTAQTNSSTLSDVQSDLSQVKQDATTLTATLKDAQGNISTLQQKADSVSAQLASAQGDIASLQTDVTGIKATLVSHEGDIHTLQADSKSLHDSMQDVQGNISTLQKTSTDVTSELQDHAGRISKVEQTASTLTNEFSDQDGRLSKVEQTATGTQQTVANQQGQINSIQTDVSGIHETITGQGNQIANINVTLSGLNTKYEGVSGDLSNLSNKAMQNRGTVSSPDFNSLTQAGYYTVTNTSGGKNYPVTNWGTLEVSGKDRLNQKYVGDNDSGTYTRQYNASTKSWTAWIKTANQNDVTALSDRITTNSTQITQNKKEIDLKADQSTVDNLTGEVSQAQAQLKVQAGQISSKVSSTDFKTLNDKVDGMKIGGRNLVAVTAEPYTMGYGIPNTTWQDGYAYEALPITVINGEILPQGAGFFHKLVPGQEYTQTVWFETDAGVKELSARITWYNDTTGHDFQPAKILEIGEHSYKVVSTYTWPGKVNNDVRLFDISGLNDAFDLTTGTYLKFGKLKLEEGNVSTDWTPAPEDLTTAIQKNATAIDQTNQKISLKADQTEVDQVKQTATQNSSRLNVMAGQISSKVTSTDVNNIVDKKGYATTSTVQSLITQKAGTINESITNLTSEMNTRNGVNLLKGTADFKPDNLWVRLAYWQKVADKYNGLIVFKTSGDWDGLAQFYPVKKGETYTFSLNARYESGSGQSSLYIVLNADPENGYKAAGVPDNLKRVNLDENWQRVSITFTVNSDGYIKPRMERTNNNKNVLEVCGFKLERGSVATPWTPAPEDVATVTQVQQITASIDGLQSTVSNKADKSQITQLSNVIQSKVSSSDFNNLRKAVDLQTLDSADINNMKTNGHYFVHNLANNPIGGWVYVDVTGDGKYRIRQDVYQDSWNKHKFRRWYGDHWTNWEEGATYSEITQLQDAINLRVQKGELLSQINLTAHNTLIQSGKIYLDSSSTVFSGRAFIPSAAIASLSADKITTGLLNTNNINLGDGRTRLMADHDNFYIQPAGSASSNSGIRMGYDSLSFMTNDIPNGHGASVPYYSINYDGSSNGSLNIQTFDHINPGGATSTQNWYSMSDLISLSKKQIDFATNNNIHMHIDDGGVTVRPTLFFGNSAWNGTWAGFTRADNSNVVQFSTGDNNGENFRVDSGARFMQYVYINGYARAQGWLTNSTLSKKMNIRKLDLQTALDKIRQDDQYLYEYKRNVAQGIHDPQASFIIDDVHDVAQYSVPREFIDQSGQYREPNVELAYLIAAFQAIDKQVQAQQSEIKALKEQLNNEQ